MTGNYPIFGIPIIYYSLRLRAKYHGDITLKHCIHSIVLRDLKLLLMSFGKLAFRSKASKSSDILIKPPKTHQGSHKTLELARLNVTDLVRRGGVLCPAVYGSAGLPKGCMMASIEWKGGYTDCVAFAEGDQIFFKYSDICQTISKKWSATVINDLTFKY